MTTKDKTENISEPQTITRFEDFTEKMLETFGELVDSGTPPCPMCKETAWVCPGFIEPPFTDWAGDPKGVLQLIPIICKRCSFVANFAKKALEE